MDNNNILLSCKIHFRICHKIFDPQNAIHIDFIVFYKLL